MRLGADFFDSIAEIEDYIGWSGLFADSDSIRPGIPI
jgi:hypothetical protein